MWNLGSDKGDVVLPGPLWTSMQLRSARRIDRRAVADGPNWLIKFAQNFHMKR